MRTGHQNIQQNLPKLAPIPRLSLHLFPLSRVSLFDRTFRHGSFWRFFGVIFADFLALA